MLRARVLRSLPALFLLPVLLLPCPELRKDQAAPERAAPVTVVLVRHAEKGTDDPRDPSLERAGEERAAALARLFGAAGVTHLYSTEYRRTRDTLAPLAAAAGLDVEVVPARDGARQVELLRSLPPGSLAVVAGHSNTVPALVTGLGGEATGLQETERGDMLGEDEYDRLFVVVRPPASALDRVGVRTLELRYGR